MEKGTRWIVRLALVAIFVTFGAPLGAAEPGDVAGTWRGAIEIPGRPIEIAAERREHLEAARGSPHAHDQSERIPCGFLRLHGGPV